MKPPTTPAAIILTLSLAASLAAVGRSDLSQPVDLSDADWSIQGDKADVEIGVEIELGAIAVPTAPGTQPGAGTVVERYRFRVLATGPDGQACFEQRSIPVGLLDDRARTILAIDVAAAEQVIARDSLGPCPADAGPDPFGDEQLAAVLTAVGRRAVPTPAFTVQPGNRALTGRAAYLDGLVMNWSGPVQLSFPATAGLAPLTVTAQADAQVIEYWVDWDFRGAFEPGGATVTGPHRDAPRGWRDGRPGNVGWTWQDAGAYRVAVLQRWEVTADVPGVGRIGPVQVEGPIGEVPVQVRQAQPVRAS